MSARFMLEWTLRGPKGSGRGQSDNSVGNHFADGGRVLTELSSSQCDWPADDKSVSERVPLEKWFPT
jgi:hypothetical protein